MGNFGFWMGIGAAQAAAQSFRVPIEGAGPGEFISSGGIELRCFGSNFD
jgi:hypothetical protein